MESLYCISETNMMLHTIPQFKKRVSCPTVGHIPLGLRTCISWCLQSEAGALCWAASGIWGEFSAAP